MDMTFYTDGGCVNNGSPKARAAWAWVCVETETERSGLVEGKQSNNTAELTAIIEALKYAETMQAKRVTIYSDSQWCINCIVGTWRAKENLALLAQVDMYAEKCEMVHFEWVQGHSGDASNERVDELCRKALGLGPGRTTAARYSSSLSPK